MAKTRKKLIEVALPLEAINVASAKEKSIRHGHPSTLHLWWARRPLAAARAVIFSQMVDDPSEYTDVLLSDPPKRRKAERELKKRLELWKLKSAQGKEDPGQEPTLTEMLAELERERLFDIIRDLVLWENTTNEVVLDRARAEIWQSWRRTCADNADHPRAKELFDRNKLPAFHDPFAGGGSLPLEAQRLGLEAHASDLNPVAVLINKALIEIPPKFAGKPPVNPEARKDLRLLDREWKGAQGLAEDVRYYGKWMRDQAEKRIGHLYPKVEVTIEMAEERPELKPLIGQKLTVIAWLWARTVRCPNPACGRDMPMIRTFWLSTKPTGPAYLDPLIDLANGTVKFAIRTKGQPRKETTNAKAAECLFCDRVLKKPELRDQATKQRMGVLPLAVVCEGAGLRLFLPAETAVPPEPPAVDPSVADLFITNDRRWFSPPLYGLPRYRDLFTSRQLVALSTFSDLANDARERIRQDSADAGLSDAERSLRNGGNGAVAYAEALGTYLAFCVDKMTDTNTCLCSWQVNPPRLRATFGRQALPMVWDYAEANIFGDAAGDFGRCVGSLTEVLDKGGLSGRGTAYQSDAQVLVVNPPRIFSTDPPYYDNIGYADLSDFFYVWLRRSMSPVFPELFTTLAVPKAEELVATTFRHGTKEKAETFFLDGMTQAMHRLAEQAHPAFPVTIYYAFKQSESESEKGTASTGWETFLGAVILAGFGISGTWPMRSELATRNVGRDTNALASSIVLVCRPRLPVATTVTRRDFLIALKAELPIALSHLQRGNIAPVDLAQAAIGPGMGVFTRYERVLDAEGKPLSVRQALSLINETLDEALAEQEGDFDPDTRWALAWFEQFGFGEGEFGVAEVLSKAKATSVEGMRLGGFLASKGGKVRLLRPAELPADWDPESDSRITVWETLHQLVRALEAGGDTAAASLVSRLGARAEVARELAYRLYTVCERKKRAAEALSYNGLVQSWPEIMRLTREAQEKETAGAATASRSPAQGAFALDDD